MEFRKGEVLSGSCLPFLVVVMDVTGMGVMDDLDLELSWLNDMSDEGTGVDYSEDGSGVGSVSSMPQDDGFTDLLAGTISQGTELISLSSLVGDNHFENLDVHGRNFDLQGPTWPAVQRPSTIEMEKPVQQPVNSNGNGSMMVYTDVSSPLPVPVYEATPCINQLDPTRQSVADGNDIWFNLLKSDAGEDMGQESVLSDLTNHSQPPRTESTSVEKPTRRRRKGGMSLAEKRARESKMFPKEKLLDISGTTSSEVRRMTQNERELVRYKRKLRNRESARRSRERSRMRERELALASTPQDVTMF